MSKVKQADIDRLVDLVGGRDNIATVSHCITRLRFVLHQPASARPKEIEQLPMVKGCFTNAGQFQVVIGTDVGDYYNALLETTGKAYADKEQAKKAARQNMKWHEQLISHFAEIFFPLLPALISGGLILGFRNVIGDVPMSNGQTLAPMHPALKTLYDFLWLIGEAIFFYLPVGICWSAVKKVGGTPILGIVLGVTLVSPQLMNAYLLGQQTPDVWNFGLFSIEKVGYQAQVIPALLAGLALGFIETHRAGLSLPGRRPGVFVNTGRLSRPHLYRPLWSYDRRRRGLCGTLSDDRQFRPDRRGAVRLPVCPVGHYRRPPDNARYRYADDPEHGRYASLAADCAVEYRAGLRRGGHHHLQP